MLQFGTNEIILTFLYSVQDRISIESFSLATCRGKGASGNGTTGAIRGLEMFPTRRVLTNVLGLCAVASLSFAADQGFARGTIGRSGRVSSCLAWYSFGH